MASLNDVALTGFGQTRNAYANLLKEWYAELWELHVHTEHQIFKMIGKKKRDRFGGKRKIAAVVDELPQSAGISLREGVKLPTKRIGNYFNPELIARDLYIRLGWTGQVERAARAGKKGAWAKPRALDIQHARKQFDLNLERKAILGPADVLGVVASHDGTTGLTLDGRNSRNSSGSDFWVSGNFYMRKNMSVGMVDSAQGALGAAAYDIEDNDGDTSKEFHITAKAGDDTSSPTVTANTDISTLTSFTPADGDFVVPYGSRASSFSGTAADDISLFAGINGMANICVDENVYSALYGLAKTSAPTLKGVFKQNPAGAGTTRPFEEMLLQQLVDQIHDKGTGNEPDCYVLNRATRRQVVLEHQGERRYAPVQTESGFAKLHHSAGDKLIPYETAWQFLPGAVAAIRKDSWGWCPQSDFGPIDQVPERWVTDFDAHEMIWHKSGNLECENPYDQGWLDDLDYDLFALTT